jgi:hypothetical protein
MGDVLIFMTAVYCDLAKWCYPSIITAIKMEAYYLLKKYLHDSRRNTYQTKVLERTLQHS